MNDNYKTIIPLEEFTWLQRRVIIELTQPKWEWRSREALEQAIEDERQRITDWVADDMATIIDRHESVEAIFQQLNYSKLLAEAKKVSHYGGGTHIVTFYSLREGVEGF